MSYALAIAIVTLIDRVILDQARIADAHWFVEESLPDHRHFAGIPGEPEPVLWTHARHICDRKYVTFMGHMDGQPALPDAVSAMKVLLLFEKFAPTVDAIILVRDMDKESDRKNGLKQARQYFERQDTTAKETNPAIIIGVADPKREAWHLAGFEPEDDEERKILASLKSGDKSIRDPRYHSHEFTASNEHEHDRKSAKRILMELTQSNLDREMKCLFDLTLLRKNGNQNGLTEFLDELSVRLCPLFFHIR